MQLGQMLGGVDIGSGTSTIKASKTLALEGSNQELELSDEQFSEAINELGLSIQELSPEMLSLLRQWLSGGALSPQAASLIPETGDKLPQSAISFADSLGQSLTNKNDFSSLFATLNQPSLSESVEGISEKFFSDMASRLSDAMSKAATEFSPHQIQVGAFSLASTDSSGQPFSQTLTNNLLSMAVPQKVTDPAWSQAMGDRLVWMVKGDQQMAEIKITPPNLGTVEIKLTINHEHASVSFVSHHAVVRDAIEQAIPRLREMMQDQSYSLGQVDVGERHQERQSADSGGQGGHSSHLSQDEFSEANSSSLLGDMEVSDASGLGLIDLFV